MFTIYTYWNSAALISALNAIVLVMGSDDWLGLMRTIGLLGLFVATSIGLLKISYREPGQYIVMLAIFYMVLFIPKVTVSVVDVRSANVGAVDNVPLGIALISTTTSHIGKYLTETFETNFGTGDELHFSKTGLNWAGNAVGALTEVRPDNPKLQEGMANFVRSCIGPEIIENMTKYTQLVNSTNIMQTVGEPDWLNPGRVVSLPSSGSDGYNVYPCRSASADAYGIISVLLSMEIYSKRAWLARKMFPDAPPATANTLIASYLPGAEGAILGASRDITEQITQAISANLLNDSAGSLGMLRNDPGAVQLAVGTATSMASSISAYRFMGMVGAEALPKFRNIVEILLISMFPIVLLVILLGGERGGAALKTYAMTFLWVQLWAPLYAVINQILTPMTAARMQAAANGFLSQTMSNTSTLNLTSYTEQGIAGGLVLMVPGIAYALVKGGEYAMSSAMGQLSSPASGAASTQGASVGLGNVAMGNTSWGNHSSGNVSTGKYDSSPSYSSGAYSRTQGAFRTTADMGTGQAFGDASSGVANLGMSSAAFKASAVSGLSSQAMQSVQKATESASAFNTSAQSAWSRFAESGLNSSQGSSVKSSGSTSQGGSSTKAATDSLMRATSWASGSGFSMNDRFSMGLAAEAGAQARLNGDKAGEAAAKKAFGLSLGGSGSASGLSSAQTEQMWNQAVNASQGKDWKETRSAVSSAATSKDGSVSADSGSRQSTGIRSDLQSAAQALQSSKVSLTQAESLQSAATKAQSMDSGATMNLANAVQAKLGGVNALKQAAAEPSQQTMTNAIAAVLSEQGGGGSAFTSTFAPGANGAPQAAAYTPAMPGEVKAATAQAAGEAVSPGGPSAHPGVQGHHQQAQGTVRPVQGAALSDGSTPGSVQKQAAAGVKAASAETNAAGFGLNLETNGQQRAVQGTVAKYEANDGTMRNQVVANAVQSLVGPAVSSVRKAVEGITGGDSSAPKVPDSWKDLGPK